jgi:hypothetical protein
VFLYSCQPKDKDLKARIAVELVKDMQALRADEKDVVTGQDLIQQKVGRRKTIRNIAVSNNLLQNKQAAGSLEDAFQRRLSKAQQDGKYMIHCVAL